MKLNPQQVGRVGGHFVAVELHRRGAYAVTFSGSMPNIDILASDVAQKRTVSIHVKTKTAGRWHTTIRRGELRDERRSHDLRWLLVGWPLFNLMPSTHVINPVTQHVLSSTAQPSGA